MDNFSDNYSSQRAFIREPSDEKEYHSANQSFIMSLLNNKLMSFCILLSLAVFFGVVFGEKNKLFTKLVPRLRGEVVLPDNYIITSIDKKYPFILKKNDPRIAKQLRYKGSVESAFDQAALNLCMKGDTVVEIGAHYGYNPVILGQILRTNGKYIAIEGISESARCLHKNIVLNDLSDTVELIKIAAADHKGTCDIGDDVLTNPDDEADNTVISKSLIVECDTLDNILKNREISLLLIDIPGAVFEVLRGAERVIEKSKKLRILMSLDTDMIDKAINIREDLNSLLQRGFKLYEVTPTTSEIKGVSIDEIINKKKMILFMKKER